jgi:hypothetical protein
LKALDPLDNLAGKFQHFSRLKICQDLSAAAQDSPWNLIILEFDFFSGEST